MPAYDFKCEKCGEAFSRVMSIGEKETKKVKCPACKSVKVRQVYSVFMAKTSKKS